MTAPKLKVVVYDDEHGSAKDIKERLDKLGGLRVDLLDPAETIVGELEARRRASRPGAARTQGPSSTPNLLDEADIFIVDYDLTLSADGTAGPAETGERVAYLARAYSRVRTIVALNQYHPTKTFDLGLVGHASSFADVNLTNDQIANPWLWGEPHDGFAPWGWPDLRTLPERQTERMKALAAREGDPVLQVLGLTDEHLVNAFDRHQLAWLSPKSADPRLATVRQVVSGGRLGLGPSDKPWSDDGEIRVAAARLAKWLERLVLPGQNILVDAPHLISRFPSLATGQDSTSRSDDAVAAVAASVNQHLFVGPWLSRPAWSWPGVSNDEAVKEVQDVFAEIPEQDRFCEDSSRFRAVPDTRPFTADVTPFSLRHVTRRPLEHERDQPPFAGLYGLADVDYQPMLNLARA